MDRVRYLDNPGGRPNTEDEFRFEQDSIRGAFEAIAKMFFSKWATETGDENFQNAVMWGCEVTVGTPSTSRDISAGYVIIEGELYEVEAETITGLTGTNEIFATAGTSNTINRTYKSGTAYPVREERKASLAQADPATPPASSVNLSQSPSSSAAGDPTESQSMIGGMDGTRGATFSPWPVLTESKRDTLTTSGFFQPRDRIYNQDDSCYQWLDERGNWWSEGRLTEFATQASVATPQRGDYIFDIGAGKIKFYTGSVWETVTSS